MFIDKSLNKGYGFSIIIQPLGKFQNQCNDWIYLINSVMFFFVKLKKEIGPCNLIQIIECFHRQLLRSIVFETTLVPVENYNIGRNDFGVTLRRIRSYASQHAQWLHQIWNLILQVINPVPKWMCYFFSMNARSEVCY